MQPLQLFGLSDYWWFYGSFVGFVLVLLALDLGVFNRKAKTMSIAAAATALVSRAYGANNTPEYHRATRQALSLSIFGGFSLAGVCWLIAPIVASRLLPHGQAGGWHAKRNYCL